MKKKQEKPKGKLSINKFQISKINNSQLIIGGNVPGNDDTIVDQHDNG